VPNNHDVVFHFSDGQRLYADRSVLQRESPYFRTMFRSGFQESGSSGAATASKSQSSAPFPDSDAESDEENDEPSSRTLEDSPQPAESESEKAEPSPKTRKVLPPPAQEEANMSRILVSDASYRTMRAILYYIYSDYIVFAPLSSFAQTTEDYRKSMVQAYLQINPTYPAPVSSKSVYAVAYKYEISVLQVAALSHFQLHITKGNVLTELFGVFCRLYEQPKTLAIQFAIDNWRSLKETEEWEDIVERAKANPDFHYVEVTSRILSRWPR